MSAGFNSKIFEKAMSRIGCSSSRKIVVKRGVDSTSSELRRLLEKGDCPGAVVVADHQTSGRGRKGRSWYSPPVGNLYLSVAVEVSGPVRETVPMLPLAAGIAAVDAIKRNAMIDCRLKWPNDVLVADKKLAGILVETFTLDTERLIAVVGLGVNTAKIAFPGDIADTATAVAIETTGQTGIEFLAAQWIGTLESLCLEVQRGERRAIIDAWRTRAEPFGRQVRIGSVDGTTRGLADDGRLIVITSENEEVLVAGGIVEPARREDPTPNP